MVREPDPHLLQGVWVCALPPPHVQAQQGVADGLGTPAGHSPGPRRDLQAGTPVCRAEVTQGMELQSCALGQSAVGPGGLNSTFPTAAPLFTCFC